MDDRSVADGDGAEFDAVRAFLREFDTPPAFGDDSAPRGYDGSGQIAQQQEEEERSRSVHDELVAVEEEALHRAPSSSHDTEEGGSAEPLPPSTAMSMTAQAPHLNNANSNASTVLAAKWGKPATAKKQPKPNSNKARDARRSELVYLRRKVLELERQLALTQKGAVSERLEGRMGMPAPASSDAGTLQGAGQNGQEQHSAWKIIVEYQQQRRTLSERENIRLKLLLENQLKIARSLENFLAKKVRSKEVEKTVQSQMEHQYQVDPPAPSRSDAAIFDELIVGIESSYSEVDTIFETSRVQQEVTSHIDVQMETDHLGNAVCLKVFANKLLPFDLHATGKAVWHHYVFAKDRLPDRIYRHSIRHHVDATHDTIVENCNFMVKLNHKSAQYNAKQVLRRYVEEERVVIVINALNAQTQFNEHASGVRFLEKGFIVMKRPQTHSPSVNETYTLVQTCFIDTPVLTDAVANMNPMKIEAIIDFVINSIAMNLTCSHQMIENVLLERATKTTGGYC
ncbi:hypothetical protein FI667_g11274, partial [Globisporangium splendens]